VRALPHGDIIGLAPPLIITKEEIDDVIARIKTALEGITRSL
jgi:L-2,4-diaminobutyrate transaminase